MALSNILTWFCSMSGLLDSYLSKYYSSTVIDKTGGVGLIPELRAAMRENEELKKDAKKRLSDLEKLDDNRCYISKVQKKFLREVFSGH